MRSADQAARASALSSRYAQATVQTTLAASVVQAWLSLRALDAQIAITQDSLRNREEALARYDQVVQQTPLALRTPENLKKAAAFSSAAASGA